MKRIILTIATVLSLTYSFSQVWEFTRHENKFEKTFFEAAGVGGEGEFPYNNPVLGIRKSKQNGVEIMMAGVNYANADNTRVKYYFDDGEAETTRISTSSDGQTYFLYLNDQSKFINQLKNGSKVYFRVYTSMGNYDYTFSLSGSTAAINKLGL